MPTFDVQQLGSHHPNIRADDWRSPLVIRLLANSNYTDGDRELVVDHRPQGSVPTLCNFKLQWAGLANDYRRCQKTYQTSVITEFAALGLSCILVTTLAQLEFTEVTRRGERADYWLGDDILLEVSGTQDGNLENLRESKRAQLQANPFKKPGFVCVVNFSNCRAFFWYYQ
ncbi:MAG: hypothetical protein AB7S38_15150 [Vulcanimicrobiota bacterium]